ncbi:NS3 [Pata virus]|nr:NS3 [Pata virus]
MLSRLIAKYEEEKTEIYEMNKTQNETLELVRYDESAARPPSYAPTAPVQIPGMPSVSLDILDKAMSNTTGTTNAQKEEKAAYASYAEAFRDNLRVRQVKRRVNEQILPRLKTELRGLKTRKTIIHITLLVAATAALLTSVSTLTGDLSITIPAIGQANSTKIEMPAWFKGFSTVFGIINLASTTVMLISARQERALDAHIAMLRKEIMKKTSYNEAVHMSMTELSEVPLDGFEIPMT